MNRESKIDNQERQSKINLLESIKAGELPIECLLIENGTYFRVEESEIYTNKKGFSISRSELMNYVHPLSIMVTEIYIREDDHLPYLMHIVPFACGWVEGKTHNIQAPDKLTADEIDKLIQS